MAFDFKALQDDTLDICQDIQGQADFTLTRVKEMINRGYRNFVKSTDAILDVLTFTTVANQVFYTSSDTANFAFAYKVISVKYITDTEFGKRLWPYPGGHIRLPQEKSFGAPSYYYLQGMTSNNLRKLGTYPIVDVSSESLEVQVYRYPTADLSANSDEPEIDDEYRDALVYYAVWRLFHSYSHLKREWRSKAIEHKGLYREMVDEFKFNNFEDDLGGHQVTDVYAEF